MSKFDIKHTSNHFSMEPLIWVTAFLLSNFRGTVIWDILKQGFGLTALPWLEVFVWIVLLLIGVRSLIHDNLVAEYLQLWRQNWILILFITFALLSLFWSISPLASLYRSMALLFSSLIGAYLGTRYSLEGLLRILFRFGTLLLITCFTLALFLPIVGVMGWELYNGAWRGIFWHKNQFGSIAAFFSLVFLVSALDQIEEKDGKSSLYIVFYLFALVVTYFSKSVAGYFLCISMSFCATLAFFWLKTRYRLTAIHYYGMIGLGVLGVAVLLANLPFILGVFGRDTSLTGRLPLWRYLMGDVVLKSPWFGHGFGAIWSDPSFRTATQQDVGWGFPVVLADNGFLDILLHVGLVGFTLFLGVLLISFVRSAKFIFRHRSIISFFPLLFMMFAILANISFSLFLETETFLWLVIIAALFIVSGPQQSTSAS